MTANNILNEIFGRRMLESRPVSVRIQPEKCCLRALHVSIYGCALAQRSGGEAICIVIIHTVPQLMYLEYSTKPHGEYVVDISYSSRSAKLIPN